MKLHFPHEWLKERIEEDFSVSHPQGFSIETTRDVDLLAARLKHHMKRPPKQ